MEERIAELIASRYWEHGIGKSDEWCRKLARDIVDLIDLAAECSGVHLNTTGEHQMHETEPDAQQMEQEDTKSP